MSRSSSNRRGDSSSKNKSSAYQGGGADAAGSSSAPVRTTDTTACLPIVYGSIAFLLGPKQKAAHEEHTHRWTLYVRGPNDEDLSVAVRRVVFHLHPSFPQPVRELSAPPFEVTERGWGEFEATIRIVWHDDAERATVLTHFLRLYPPPPPPGTTTTTGAGARDAKHAPVVHEFYDEIVFTNPTEDFLGRLRRWSMTPKIQSAEPTVQENFPRYDDEKDFKALLAAQRFLETELVKVKDRILVADAQSRDIEARMRNNHHHLQGKQAQPAPNSVASSTTHSGPSNKKSKTSN